MPMWQYAQLVIRTDGSRAGGGARSIRWRGPGSGAVRNYSASNPPVTVLLNQLGAEGWELVGIQNYREAPVRPGPDEPGRLVSQYIFKRPYVPTLVSLTAYRLGPGSAPSETTGSPVSEWGEGRLLIERKIARPYNQADIDRIDSFRIEREESGTSARRREQIDEAVAGYAASFLEEQAGDAWWATPEDFPLVRAADLLDGSAEWLRGLVGHPLEEVASAAGADGPVVALGAGVTANFVTARLTVPLEAAARLCEVAGIVVGLAAGAHPLVMACAKRLGHDALGRTLTGEFKKILGSMGEDRETPDSREAAGTRDDRGAGDSRRRREPTERGNSQERAPGSDRDSSDRPAYEWNGPEAVREHGHPDLGDRTPGRPNDPADDERWVDPYGQGPDRSGRGDGPDTDDRPEYGGRG
jgi:hypothetical protein